MIMIWTGFGCLVPVLFLFVTMMISGGIDLITSFFHIALITDLGNFIGLFIASVLCWIAGKKINKNSVKILLDENTGQRVQINRVHSLFFIPFEYWSIVGAIGSVILLVQSVGLVS